MLDTPYSLLTEVLPFLFLQVSACVQGWLLYRINRHWFSALESFLAAVVLLVAWITVLQIGLGLGHLLRIEALCTGQVIGLLGLGFYIRRRLKPLDFTDIDQTSSTSWLVSFLAILTTLYFLFLLWRVPFAYPYRVDVMAYHLPFVVHWMQTHSLNLPEYLQSTSQAGYPGGHELLVHWMMVGLRSDLFVMVVNSLFLVLLAPAMLALGGNLNAPRWAVWLAILLVVSCPLMEWLPQTLYVEIAYAFFFVCAANFGLLYIEKGDKFAGWIFSLAFALAAGIKTTHLAYGGLLIIFLVAYAFINKPRVHLHWGNILGMLLVSTCLVAGYWYLRNLIRFGNPIYPFSPGFLADALSGNAERHALEDSHSLIRHIGDLAAIRLWLEGLLIRVGLWSWLLILSTLLTPTLLIFYLIKPTHRADSRIRLWLLWGLLILGCLGVYWITPWQVRLDLPLHRQRLGFIMQAIRYGLPWLALGALLMAMLARNWVGKVLLSGSVLGLVAMAMMRKLDAALFIVPGQDRFLSRWNLLLAILIAAGLAWLLNRLKWKTFLLSRWFKVAIIAMLFFGMGYSLSRKHYEVRSLRQDDRYRKILLHIPLPECQKLRRLPEGTTIFLWGSLTPYIFYGQSLDQVVMAGSSRDEKDNIDNIPWDLIQKKRPSVVYCVGNGKEQSGVRSIPVQLLREYRLVVDTPEAVLMVVRDMPDFLQ